ncbi:uncharacterized protein PFL1_06365 [Pseudozyma flocculosa PF-1]|uniref:5'-deoxynucleotidase n=1 Tax=Pseudozyma flocculosa PF-1 TaxID=1277687 RepID=A0A061H113_9BASI|nr:uncharacterized protein PFL1_06365 [Pseudozyma flocculosa PF-1]EPQ26157.1 hypothetical protein PFL1_06365 [Pseudozyma flocculosa PF-1]
MPPSDTTTTAADPFSAPPATPQHTTAATTRTTTPSNASTATANEYPLHEWSCRCLNVRLRLTDDHPVQTTDNHFKPAQLADSDSVRVTFPYLIARENVSLPDTGLTLTCTRCLNCSTLVYGAAKPAPPGPARTYGFLPASSSSASAATATTSTAPPPPESPSREPSGLVPTGSSSSVRAASRDARPYEPFVRPLDGQVVLLPDALTPQEAQEAHKSTLFSPAFRILVQRDASTPSSSQAETAEPVPVADMSNPGRPSIGGNRRPSVGPLPSAAMSYTLPAVPAHLITSPPQSPRATSGSAGAGAASTSNGVPASSSMSLLAGSSLGHPLASMLDSAAVERLREFRSKAEAEVFELVRQKRREMEALEKRTRDEAEALLEATRARKPAASLQAGGGAGSLMSVALGKGNLNGVERGRGRGSSVAAPEAVRSRDFVGAGASSATGALSSSGSSSQPQPHHGYPDLGDHEHDHDLDLPPSAFERRSTPAHGAGTSSAGRPASMSTSLSALSASFAMRGRDPPPQLEDWASKRRLRERYPEGDHSAMTSAVNSTANSTVDSNNNSDDESDNALARRGEATLRSDRSQRMRETSHESVNTEDEAEMADRGRGRGVAALARESETGSRPSRPPLQAGELASSPPPRGLPANAPATAPAETSSRGRQGRAPGPSQLAPPGMASSYKSKAPASVLVDDGKTADADTPQVGGRLVSPQSAPEPSAEVTLRPRNPPPSNTEPLKPATRAGNGPASRAKAVLGASATAADGSATDNPSADATGSTANESKPHRPAEKKVAFAEAEDTVDNDVLSEDDEDDADDDDDDVANGSRELVDETDAAVFEIDEESQANGDDNEAEDDEADAVEEEDTEAPRPVDGSPPGVRRGVSGRVRGQGDDFPLDDDDDAEGDDEVDRETTVRDDSASVDDMPGFGAASFSALAARESAMSDLATSLAHADDSGFDPASLRLDGRVVPETAAGFNDGGSEPFVVGSASVHGYRGYSGSFRPSSISRGRRSMVADSDSVQPSSGSPSTTGNVVGRSGSKSRAVGGGSTGSVSAKKAKEDADTEIRLSVAPNAPSHRSLWSPKTSKSQKGGKSKYQLDEEDDQKWAAWQRKIRESESSQPDDGDAGLGRSVPMNVAPPARFLAAGGAVGGRPMRGPALGAPRAGIASPSGADPSSASGSGASASAISISMSRRSPGAGYGYGSFYDSKSGFDREPKTSLPYNEKMLVPSLRKAIRRSAYEQLSKLETIEDNADAEVSPNAAAADPSGPSASIVKPVPSKATSAEAKTPGALPASVVTKGFVVPRSKDAATDGKVEDKPTATFTYKPLSAKGAALSSDANPLAGASGRSVSESLVATIKDAGRPPPPTSYSIVLKSDPAMAPKPLEVFEVEADRGFSLYEEGEEEETEEGWQKTLQFLHTIEKLKTNPRTGWLHHRVAKPESIADHMYRMGLMALLLPKEADVDLGKCVMLALVHDLAEAEVGDLTPLDGVSKDEKMRREHEAILYFAHDLLGSSAAGLRIEELWNEYEERKTKESKLVKDLDRFELCLQAVEYERREGINDLQPFYEGSLPQIRHPRVRRWAVELARERQRMWEERGVRFEQPIRE